MLKSLLTSNRREQNYWLDMILLKVLTKYTNYLSRYIRYIRLFTIFFQQKSVSLELTYVMMTYAPNVLLTGLRCQLTLSFWDLFQTWWTSKTKECDTLKNSMILYGIFDNREHLYTLNYTLLIPKYTAIYSSWLQEKKSFVLTVFSRF